MSFEEITARAERLLSVMLVLGPSKTLHAVPFQCSMTVVFDVPVAAKPTAQTSLVDTPATPLRMFCEVLGFGLGTIDQAVPFQCSINVVEVRRSLLKTTPTAQTALCAKAETA